MAAELAEAEELYGNTETGDRGGGKEQAFDFVSISARVLAHVKE